MEEIRNVQMKIIYNTDKPHLCDAKCDYCRLDTIVHPDEAFCDFYREDLFTQLDFEHPNTLRIERCNACKADSINKISTIKDDPIKIWGE